MCMWLRALLTLALLVGGNSVTKVPLSEVLGLKALYDSTNGPEWTWLSASAGDAWDFTGNLSLANPCDNWQGIDCTCISSMQQSGFYSFYYDDDDSYLSNSDCNIRKVYLSYYGLDGVLPSDFFTKLPYLTHLHLSGNNLYSTVPSSISALSNLHTLVIKRNALEGTLDVFSNLKNLQVFSFYGNYFSGSLSPLQGLTDLVFIDTGYNLVSGTIEPLANLVNMQHLAVTYGYLDGELHCLSRLTSLRQLYVGLNYFEGNLSVVSNMPSLTAIVAHGNLLTGDLSGFRDLADLKYLSLYKNQLSGSLSHLQSLHRLYHIDLYTNSITGTLAPLSGLTSMTYLDVAYNSVSGTLEALSSLVLLESLYLNENMLSGTLSPGIEDMTSLQTLWLFGNDLSGDLQALSDLTSLEDLRLFYNSLTGSLAPLSGLTSMTYFDAGYNSISGTLEALSSLVLLESLYLNENMLSGTLSPGIEDMASLQTLWLFGNDLSGDLQALSNLTSLEEVNLYANILTGTLEYLAGLSNLTYLSLEGNYIRGTVEPISTLNLTKIYLSFNMLTGTIASLSNVKSSLQYLYLFQNDLSGDLQVLRDMTSLVQVSLYQNHFYDNLEPFRGLYNLTYLDVEENYMTGSIDAIANLTKLSYLYLSSNWFMQQSISALANMTGLVYLGLLDNQFTGSVEVLSAFTSLSYLEINDNHFTGDISTWYMLTNLTRLDISSNLLTGTLDALLDSTGLIQFDASGNLLEGNLNVFDGMVQLRYFNIEGCGMTGGLPSSLSLCSELTYLNVNNNFLSGTIPSLSDATYLTALLLSTNAFTGSLDFISPSPSSPFSYLTVIDIHNNMFTGSIPPSWFGLTTIEYVIAAVNCLDVTFPDSVCNMISLQGLVLDGLHSAPSCSYILPIKIIDTIYQTTQVISDIPRCMYELPAIRTLHMSGNGISSSLPSDVNVSQSLKELVLSNNDIRGIIPASFQNHPFDILDLSYNKITGTLSDRMAVNESVSLLVNRLSGSIPHTLFNTKTVDILSGNMYSCDKRTISRLNDVTTDGNYTCGSTTFTYAAIIWFVVLTLVATLIAVSYVSPERIEVQWLRKHVANIQVIRKQIMDTTAIDELLAKHGTKVSISKNIHFFVAFTNNCRKYFGLVTAVILFVYLPIYVSLNSRYSTYTETYAWSATVAYLSGVTPASVLLVLYLLSIVLPLCYYREDVLDVISYGSKSMVTRVFKQAIGNKNTTKINKTRTDEDGTRDSENMLSTLTREEYKREKRNNAIAERNKLIVLIVTLFLNVIIVTSINGCYVYLSLKYSNTVVAICEFLLASFKSVWTSVLLFLIEYVENRVSSTVSKDKSRHLNFLTIVVMVNNIVLPCLALSLVNPDCFYNALYSKDAVSTTISYSVCESYDDYAASTLTCVNYFSGFTYGAIETIKYTPPYSYSNECSSAILTSYVPVFLYTALFSFLTGVLNPIIDIGTVQFLSYAARHPDNKQLAWMVSLVTALKRFTDYAFDTEYSTNDEEFNQTGFCLSLNSTVIVMFTFGALSPFLAVMTYLSINSTLFYSEYRIGKYLLTDSKPGDVEVSTNPLATALSTSKIEGDSGASQDLECDHKIQGVTLSEKRVQTLDGLLLGVENRIIKSAWYMLPCIGLFYSIFIWDIAGDEVGLTKALWGPLLMMLTVMLVFAYPSMHYYILTFDMKLRHRFRVDRKFDSDVQIDTIYETQKGVASYRIGGGTEMMAEVQPSGVELVQNPLLVRPR